jgi:hypothetical protein
MNKNHAIRKTGYVLAATGALVGVGVGVAYAAPAPAVSAMHRAAAARDPRVGSPTSSTGIHLYNNSFDKLTLTGVSGDSEGVPSIGSVLAPGVGFQDFEVTFRAAKSTTVTANYDVFNATNLKLGTSTIKLSNNEWDDTSVHGTFTATDGSTLPLKTGSDNGGFQVEGNDTTQIDVDASSTTASDLVNNYCNTVNTNATCSFTPTNRTATKQMKLLATGYTEPGGDNTPGTVSVSGGYSATTSDSWSVTVTATMELADVYSEAISTTYGQSVSWTNTFSAGDSIGVNPGYTGYIWGDVPVIQYTGTMQVQLGNTTYEIQNAALSTPDPSRALSDFYAGTWLGNDPLGSPSQPPSGTDPLSD